MKLCSVDGCEDKHRAQGFCVKHYHRIARNRKELTVEVFDVDAYWLWVKRELKL